MYIFVILLLSPIAYFLCSYAVLNDSQIMFVQLRCPKRQYNIFIVALHTCVRMRGTAELFHCYKFTMLGDPYEHSSVKFVQIWFAAFGMACGMIPPSIKSNASTVTGHPCSKEISQSPSISHRLGSTFLRNIFAIR